MRVSDFDDFDRFETEGLLTGTKERSWLWFGLIVSLGIHLALCAYFYRTRFQTVEALTPPNEQTPTFKVRSINTSDLGCWRLLIWWGQSLYGLETRPVKIG